MYRKRWFTTLLLLSSPCSARSALPPLIPAVHSFVANEASAFDLPTQLSIIVDQHAAESTRDNGLTSIPPTLLSFATTFASDVNSLFSRTSAKVELGTTSSLKTLKGYVFLTISESLNATFADGTPTTEGYTLESSPSGIVITGSGAKGAFWGTRTLLQGLVLSEGHFPSGSITDQPDWRTRGIMLDVGRQWYPIDFLTELCTYASWFKISEFHVHLSDNIVGATFDGYARFRLRPEDPSLLGLTPHLNETYSRSEFDDFQSSCAARGVTIIPEIEHPGHALVINQWKPELALSTDVTLINLTVPDAIPTIKSIWQEFLPWFHTQQVSIGADEYNSSLADDYNDFVNTMSDYIRDAGKGIRIWGTNEPSNKTSVQKNITIQHWDFSDDDPYQLIQEGYDVINSDDAFNYIVMKQSGSFGQMLNQTRLWDGANVNTGGIWDPHIFDRGNASNNPAINDPHLKGAIMAVWNDHGPTVSTYLEAFYAVKAGLPVVAAAHWQSASRPNHLTQNQYLSSFPALEAAAPGQNLDRRIASKGAVVVDYTVSQIHSPAILLDASGNGYDATVKDGVISTPLGSKGHNYTLLIEFSPLQDTGILMSGPDTSFGFVATSDGSTLAFTSSNISYPLQNYTLPRLSHSPTYEIILTGTENGTSAYVDGGHAGDFLVNIPSSTLYEPMAFVAPVQTIGGRNSTVTRFKVWNGLQDITQISKET